MASTNNIVDDVKDYYGKKLKSLDDLETSACTTPEQKMPKYIRDVLSQIHDEVVRKYYGCGLIIPHVLENMNILDLGSGSGRDCYVLSKLVGENGSVIGVDMTDEQLEVANRHIDYHTKIFGFSKTNIKFVKGYIEKLQEAGIADSSLDVIVSNCVINLCKDKKAVLTEAFRILNDGGELYFSDVYADRQLSDEIRSHKVLWGECISGALYWKDLYKLAKEIGFETPRTVTLGAINVSKPELKEIVGDAKFASVVYRLFKLPKDVGRTPNQAIYNGSVTGCDKELQFDRHYTFKEGDAVTVDGDTSAILKGSRFKDDFMFRKAPCCAKYTEVAEEDPFKILASGDAPDDNAGSCCPESGGCC